MLFFFNNSRFVFHLQNWVKNQRKLKVLFVAYSSLELAISKNIYLAFKFFEFKLKKTFFSAWIEENNIKNYLEYKEQLIKSSKTAAFKEAVQKIEEYISDPVVR